MSTARSMSEVTLGRCSWTIEQSKQPEKSTMTASQTKMTIETRTPSQESIPWKAKLRSWYLGRELMRSRGPTNTPAPCVSRKSAQTPSSGCSSWIHMRYSDISGTLKPDFTLRCQRCTGQARPIDGRLMTEVIVRRGNIEVVSSFCYLGNCSGGSCEFVSITRYRVDWDNPTSSCLFSYPAHFPLLQWLSLQLVRQERHASETWASTSCDLHHLQHNDRAVIRWMHGPVECSDDLLMKAQKLNAGRGRGRDGPRNTWSEVICLDCLALGSPEAHLKTASWCESLKRCT